MMISVMVDGDGYLIVNREEVHGYIEDFEYSPRPGEVAIIRVGGQF